MGGVAAGMGALLQAALAGVVVTTGAAAPQLASLYKPAQPVGFSQRLLGSFLDQNIGNAFGVVLGVGSGQLALELLGTWPRGVLFLVDPYIHLRRGYDREENLQDDEHQRQYEHLRNVLHDMPSVQGRYSFAREFSFSIPQLWRQKQWGPEPRFVYHDANPSYGAVRTDLHAWWSLLSPGGIMAGTNFTAVGDGSVVGVRLAVEEFAAEHGLQIFVTSDAEPTWLILKGEHGQHRPAEYPPQSEPKVIYEMR